MFTFRDATAADAALVKRAIFAAWTWRDPWDEVAFEAHRAAGIADSYGDGFGQRPGDAGVVAEDGASAGTFVGAAWYRYFTEAEHRSGFIAPAVPEAVIAVEAGARGRGVGRQLVERLVEMARQRGVDQLSLHVSRENARARHLYDVMGFVETQRGDERGAVMLLQVSGSADT